MASILSVVFLISNTIVFIYYGGKWFKIRSIQKRLTSCEVVYLTKESLNEAVGKYVFISGSVKSLTKGIPSKYSGELVTAVIQNIQRIKHQIVRAGFWIKKRSVLEFSQCLHTKLAFINDDVKVEIKDPIWGLSEAAKNDLFTGYRNTTWPVSNIINDSFTFNTEATNPYKVLLMGIHEIGVQETESIVLNGGYIGAMGHLQSKNGEISILVDLLTMCNREMLLQKVSDIRSEYASKMLVIGTFGAIFAGILCRRLWIENRNRNKGENQ